MLSCIDDQICNQFPKVDKVDYAVYPYDTGSGVDPKNISKKQIIEPADNWPYHAVLGIAECVDHTMATYVMENNGLRSLLNQMSEEKVTKPSMNDLNWVVYRIISGSHCGQRFKSEANVSFKSQLCNLIPFPRVHHFYSSLFPIYPHTKNDLQKTKYPLTFLNKEMKTSHSRVALT